MKDDYRWMPAAMFEMAATCRNEGMTEACNLLTESAILLHVCLAQKPGSPQNRVSLWDTQDEGAFHPQDAIASPVHDTGQRTADVCVLRPRVVAQQESRVSS